MNNSKQLNNTLNNTDNRLNRTPNEFSRTKQSIDVGSRDNMAQAINQESFVKKTIDRPQIKEADKVKNERLKLIFAKDLPLFKLTVEEYRTQVDRKTFKKDILLCFWLALNCGYLTIVKYISQKEPSINNLIRNLKVEGQLTLQIKQTDEKRKNKKNGEQEEEEEEEEEEEIEEDQFLRQELSPVQEGAQNTLEGEIKSPDAQEPLPPEDIMFSRQHEIGDYVIKKETVITMQTLKLPPIDPRQIQQSASEPPLLIQNQQDEIDTEIKTKKDIEDIKFLLGNRQIVKNFKTDVDFKFGAPLNTDILRIALNLKESSVAAVIVANYNVRIDEDMIIKAVKTMQFEFLEAVYAFNKNYEVLSQEKKNRLFNLPLGDIRSDLDNELRNKIFTFDYLFKLIIEIWGKKANSFIEIVAGWGLDTTEPFIKSLLINRLDTVAIKVYQIFPKSTNFTESELVEFAIHNSNEEFLKVAFQQKFFETKVFKRELITKLLQILEQGGQIEIILNVFLFVDFNDWEASWIRNFVDWSSEIIAKGKELNLLYKSYNPIMTICLISIFLKSIGEIKASYEHETKMLSSELLNLGEKLIENFETSIIVERIFLQTDFLNRSLLKLTTYYGFSPLIRDVKVKALLDELWIGKSSNECDGKQSDFSMLDFMHSMRLRKLPNKKIQFSDLLAEEYKANLDGDFQFQYQFRIPSIANIYNKELLSSLLILLGLIIINQMYLFLFNWNNWAVDVPVIASMNDTIFNDGYWQISELNGIYLSNNSYIGEILIVCPNNDDSSSDNNTDNSSADNNTDNNSTDNSTDNNSTDNNTDNSSTDNNTDNSSTDNSTDNNPNTDDNSSLDNKTEGDGNGSNDSSQTDNNNSSDSSTLNDSTNDNSSQNNLIFNLTTQSNTSSGFKTQRKLQQTPNIQDQSNQSNSNNTQDQNQNENSTGTGSETSKNSYDQNNQSNYSDNKDQDQLSEQNQSSDETLEQNDTSNQNDTQNETKSCTENETLDENGTCTLNETTDIGPPPLNLSDPDVQKNICQFQPTFFALKFLNTNNSYDNKTNLQQDWQNETDQLNAFLQSSIDQYQIYNMFGILIACLLLFSVFLKIIHNLLAEYPINFDIWITTDLICAVVYMACFVFLSFMTIDEMMSFQTKAIYNYCQMIMCLFAWYRIIVCVLLVESYALLIYPIIEMIKAGIFFIIVLTMSFIIFIIYCQFMFSDMYVGYQPDRQYSFFVFQNFFLGYQTFFAWMLCYDTDAEQALSYDNYNLLILYLVVSVFLVFILAYLVAIFGTIFETERENGEFAFECWRLNYMERFQIAFQDKNRISELIVHPPPMNVFLFFILPFIPNFKWAKNVTFAFSITIFWVENVWFILIQFLHELSLVPLIYFDFIFQLLRLEGIKCLDVLILWLFSGFFYLLYKVGYCVKNYIKILSDYKLDQGKKERKKEKNDYLKKKVPQYNETLDVLYTILFIYFQKSQQKDLDGRPKILQEINQKIKLEELVHHMIEQNSEQQESENDKIIEGYTLDKTIIMKAWARYKIFKQQIKNQFKESNNQNEQLNIRDGIFDEKFINYLMANIKLKIYDFSEQVHEIKRKENFKKIITKFKTLVEEEEQRIKKQKETEGKDFVAEEEPLVEIKKIFDKQKEEEEDKGSEEAKEEEEEEDYDLPDPELVDEFLSRFILSGASSNKQHQIDIKLVVQALPKRIDQTNVRKIELFNFENTRRSIISFQNDNQDEMFEYYDSRKKTRLNKLSKKADLIMQASVELIDQTKEVMNILLKLKEQGDLEQIHEEKYNEITKDLPVQDSDDQN